MASYSVSSFSDSRALLASNDDFDLIFLDVRMEQPDGVETARILRKRGSHSLLVFVTVLKEYVFDVFEVEACDYLLKPLDNIRFRRTMDRAVRSLEQRTAKSIVVRKGTSCEVILLSRIVYCEVQGRKIYIHQKDGRVTDYYDKMQAFEQRVDARFFKCHRSYLVNLDYVRGCNNGQVMLPQGGRIPVSRLREQDLIEALLRYRRGRGCC